MFYKLPLQIKKNEGALYLVQNCTSDTPYKNVYMLGGVNRQPWTPDFFKLATL